MSNHLSRYRKMRDFDKTPEPSGGPAKRRGSKLPSFVIQKHDASRLHYDFRLEIDGVLKSWAVPKGPSYDPATKRLAMMTEDHPLEYGSFEGIIPTGNYGAGNVIIWDHGQWEYIEPGDDPAAGLEQGKLTFRLMGKKMFGEWALVRIGGRESNKGNEWLLIKHKDEWVNSDVDVTEVAPLSVVSGRDVSELGEGDETWRSDRSDKEPRSGRKKASGTKRKGTAKRTSRKKSSTGGSKKKR